MFYIPMSAFDSRRSTAEGDVLSGCSANGGAWDITKLELKNWSDKFRALLCIDDMQLIG
jgi:hypothetical protein